MAYNKDVNYKEEMDKAAGAGDFLTAAALEKSRNEKISGEGISDYQPTNIYGGFLGGGLSAKAPPEYQNPYKGQIDDLYQQLMDRPSFSYDHTKDPLYEQYEKSYTRQGQRAMQDTLAQVSARTGGLASSYAVTAASQANDGYMAQLADKLPELRQLAYSMYMDEGNQKRANLDTLMGMEQGDYAKYADGLGQFNADRNFSLDMDKYAYGQGQDAMDRAWDQGGREHDWAGEALDRQERQDATAYQKEQGALSQAYEKDTDAYNRAMDLWQTTGELNEAGAKILGIPAGTMTADHRFRLAQEARASAPSSRSYSGGNSGGQDVETGGDIADLFRKMQESGNPYLYLSSNRKGYNLDSSAINGVMKEYEGWAEGERKKIAAIPGTDDYRDILERLGKVEDSSLNDAAKAGKMIDTIQSGYEGGHISESEAKRLLSQYGLG